MVRPCKTKGWQLPQRQTRARSRMVNAAPLMTGLDNRGQPVEALPPSSPSIPYLVAAQRDRKRRLWEQQIQQEDQADGQRQNQVENDTKESNQGPLGTRSAFSVGVSSSIASPEHPPLRLRGPGVIPAPGSGWHSPEEGNRNTVAEIQQPTRKRQREEDEAECDSPSEKRYRALEEGRKSVNSASNGIIGDKGHGLPATPPNQSTDITRPTYSNPFANPTLDEALDHGDGDDIPDCPRDDASVSSSDAPSAGENTLHPSHRTSGNTPRRASEAPSLCLNNSEKADKFGTFGESDALGELEELPEGPVQLVHFDTNVSETGQSSEVDESNISSDSSDTSESEALGEPAEQPGRPMPLSKTDVLEKPDGAPLQRGDVNAGMPKLAGGDENNPAHNTRQTELASNQCHLSESGLVESRGCVSTVRNPADNLPGREEAASMVETSSEEPTSLIQPDATSETTKSQYKPEKAPGTTEYRPDHGYVEEHDPRGSFQYGARENNHVRSTVKEYSPDNNHSEEYDPTTALAGNQSSCLSFREARVRFEEDNAKCTGFVRNSLEQKRNLRIQGWIQSIQPGEPRTLAPRSPFTPPRAPEAPMGPQVIWKGGMSVARDVGVWDARWQGQGSIEESELAESNVADSEW